MDPIENFIANNESDNNVLEPPIVDKEGEIDDLIAQLCMDAPSDPVKFCLRLYQHGKSLAQLEKDFEREKSLP